LTLTLQVVLRAVHFISMNEGSPRICEVLLNIINCLLDLDIIEMKAAAAATPVVNKGDNSDSSGSGKSSIGPSESDVTAHALAMECLTRYICLNSLREASVCMYV
jgi:hypothetical protein